jgi:HTH-type transcriptional regulator, competence development regulator
MTDSSPTLGPTLKALRDLQDKSLKAIADQADISAAYLQKLERGEVTAPSPHVLHRLAGVLCTDYLELMRSAGYVVPESPGSSGALAQALSAQNLTDDEARALSTFLKMYRKDRGG